MNKTELINAIALETKSTKKDVDIILKSFINQITKTLKKDEKVQIIGFGTFEARKRAERIGRNPRTKEEITIPATVSPTFKPGKEFKEGIK